MTSRSMTHLMLTAGTIIGGAAMMAALWDVRLGAGIVAGGLWNMASLWCLTRLLSTWLGPQPSRRRTVAWLLVKFPLLYLAVFGMLRLPTVSATGFGIGFTLMLVAAITWFALRTDRTLSIRMDGR